MAQSDWTGKRELGPLLPLPLLLLLIAGLRPIDSLPVIQDGALRFPCDPPGDPAPPRMILPKVANESVERFPMVVNVLRKKVVTHVCTGILIKDDMVLVPATCVDENVSQSEKFPVVVVGTNLAGDNDDGEGMQVRSVCKQIIHDKFTGDPKDGYDLALLALNESVSVDRLLPLHQSEMPKRFSRSVGFFKAHPKGAPSKYLQYFANMEHLQREKCSEIMGSLPVGTICTLSGPRTACEWDTGALLLSCSNKTGDALIGMASYAPDVCQENIPYIYTDLMFWNTWIHNNGAMESRIQENADCGKQNQNPDLDTSKGSQHPDEL